MFKIKNLIDQVENLVVKNTPKDELDMNIPPPLGYGDPTIYRRRHVYSHPPHITCDNHSTGDMCCIMQGGRGSGSPRHAVRMDSPRV